MFAALFKKSTPPPTIPRIRFVGNEVIMPLWRYQKIVAWCSKAMAMFQFLEKGGICATLPWQDVRGAARECPFKEDDDRSYLQLKEFFKALEKDPAVPKAYRDMAPIYARYLYNYNEDLDKAIKRMQELEQQGA